MEKFLKYEIKPTLENNNENHVKFEIVPLQKGFGITIGNALRRTLLSSIPGSAMFAIKIPNVTHEFQALKGIKEDVNQIILNLKNLVIKISESSYSDEELASLKLEQWPTLKINKSGAGVVSAKDIEAPAGFEILNKDLYICEITDPKTTFKLDIYATRGRGFKTFSENREMVNTLSVIATDSNFSPIIQVGYSVADHKSSKTVTNDALTIEVTTNGSINATDAVILATKILVEHLNPILDLNETIKQLSIVNEEIQQKKANTLSIQIEDLNLSVRSYNCLKKSGIQTIEELTNLTKAEVEKINNLGKKSLREIKKHWSEYGLKFKDE